CDGQTMARMSTRGRGGCSLWGFLAKGKLEGACPRAPASEKEGRRGGGCSGEGRLEEGRRWLNRLRGSVERWWPRLIGRWRAREHELLGEVGNGAQRGSLCPRRFRRGSEWGREKMRRRGCA